MDDEYKWRKEKAEVLKAKFNSLWGEALAQGNGVLSYLDMVRIADVMRFDARSLLDGRPLPMIIETGLELAIAIVNPNKIAQKEGIKKAMALAGGIGGAGIIVAFLIPILYPVMGAGLWYGIVGGIAGGIAGPIGIVGGAGICLGAVCVFFQKMSPNRRAASAHMIVQEAINKWVKEAETKPKGLPFFRKKELNK